MKMNTCWLPRAQNIPRSLFISFTINKITTQGFDDTFNFTLTGDNFNSSFSITTVNSSGSYVFPHLNVGNYTLIEISIPGWSTNIPINLMLDANNNSVTLINQKTANLTINKTTDLGDDTFTFTITPAINGQSIFNITTVNNVGSITINNVLPGNYNVTETIIPGWINSLPVQLITMNGNDLVINFDNIKAGRLFIVKNSGNFDETFTFDLTGPVNQNFNITTVNGMGNFIIDDLPYGNYTLTEQPKFGWISTSPQPVIISPNSNFTVIFENSAVGFVQITKTTFPLVSNVDFDFVIQPNNTTASVTVTNGFGLVVIGNIKAGINQTITELPSPGWVPLPPQMIIINNPGDVVNVNFNNIADIP